MKLTKKQEEEFAAELIKLTREVFNAKVDKMPKGATGDLIRAFIEIEFESFTDATKDQGLMKTLSMMFLRHIGAAMNDRTGQKIMEFEKPEK